MLGGFGVGKTSLVSHFVHSIFSEKYHITIGVKIDIQKRTQETIGDVPFVLVLNKSDLVNERRVKTSTLDGINKNGWSVIESSAKLGTGVEEIFNKLTTKILPKT